MVFMQILRFNFKQGTEPHTVNPSNNTSKSSKWLKISSNSSYHVDNNEKASNSWLQASSNLEQCDMETLSSSNELQKTSKGYHSSCSDRTLAVTQDSDTAREPGKAGNVEKTTAGYINEIVLNSKAMKEVGDIKVTWKYRTTGERMLRYLVLQK